MSDRDHEENGNDVEGHLLELDRSDDLTTEKKPEQRRDDSDDEEPDVEAHGGWRSF